MENVRVDKILGCLEGECPKYNNEGKCNGAVELGYKLDESDEFMRFCGHVVDFAIEESATPKEVPSRLMEGHFDVLRENVVDLPEDV